MLAILHLSMLGFGANPGSGMSCHRLSRTPTSARNGVNSIYMNHAKVGDQVIAGNDWNSSSPEYGIVRAQAYELQRVYYQGIGSDGQVERRDVDALDAPPPSGCAGYTKYISLFSGRYHRSTGAVVVKPTEINVVTVRSEIIDSAWLALPGLFWVWLAYTIYMYGVEHGFIF